MRNCQQLTTVESLVEQHTSYVHTAGGLLTWTSMAAQVATQGSAPDRRATRRVDSPWCAAAILSRCEGGNGYKCKYWSEVEIEHCG